MAFFLQLQVFDFDIRVILVMIVISEEKVKQTHKNDHGTSMEVVNKSSVSFWLTTRHSTISSFYP